MALSLEEVVSRFERAKRQADGSYKVLCPCHMDREPSLSISNGMEPGKILVYCHAGCDTRDILDEVGLTMSDLGSEKLEVTWKSKLEQQFGKSVEAVYNYTDEQGRYLYSKVRLEGKVIRYGVLDRQSDVLRPGAKGVEKVLYNLPALVKAVRGGYPVYFVEGEKDVETLKKLGLTAVTCGGANDWRREYAQYFTGARLIILPDNDAPGLDLAAKVMADTKNFAHSQKVVKTSSQDHGDVSDYIAAGGTKETLKALVDSEPAQLAPWVYIVNQGKANEAQKVNEDRLAECILKTLDYVVLTERGTGADMFYVYENGVYTPRGKNEIKSIVRRRVPFGLGRDDIFNKTTSLLMCSGGNIHGFNDINSDEWIINTKNGLYDVKQRKMIPHSSKVLSTIQLDCSFPEQYHEPPVWTGFISDLCTDEEGKLDIEMVYMLQEWLGAAVSNLKMQRFKKVLALFSLMGNTGKSQYLAMMKALVGSENIANIPIQNMSGRWSMAEAYGKRLILVGDQNAYDVEDSSVFKQITGGDVVRAEFKNKMAFSYVFNGAVTIACNDLPSFKDDKGGHVFERFLLAHCRNVIPPAKRDGALLDKMLKEKDQIFRWALIGLHRLIDNKFKFTACQSSVEAEAEWRRRVDTLYRFMEECCEITGDIRHDRIQKKEFEEKYEAFCFQKEIKNLERKNIKDRAEKNGVTFGKVRGEWCYKGIKWKI